MIDEVVAQVGDMGKCIFNSTIPARLHPGHLPDVGLEHRPTPAYHQSRAGRAARGWQPIGAQGH